MEFFEQNLAFPESGIGLTYTSDLTPFMIFYLTSVDAKKEFNQLSDKEKAAWKLQYDEMPDEDEPPYPIGGLISILRPMAALADLTWDKGKLIVHLEIDADGKPRRAELLASPSKEFGPKAIAALMDASYKPGKCRGQPCVMSIPIRIRFLRK
jgi:hypothetical protein